MHFDAFSFKPVKPDGLLVDLFALFIAKKLINFSHYDWGNDVVDVIEYAFVHTVGTSSNIGRGHLTGGALVRVVVVVQIELAVPFALARTFGLLVRLANQGSQQEFEHVHVRRFEQNVQEVSQNGGEHTVCTTNEQLTTRNKGINLNVYQQQLSPCSAWICQWATGRRRSCAR